MINAKKILFERIKEEPICSPIGDIAISAPTLNKAIPMIKKTAAIEKTTISFVDKSNKGVKKRMMTIAVTGSTEKQDSFNLSSRFLSMQLLYKKCLFFL